MPRASRYRFRDRVAHTVQPAGQARERTRRVFSPLDPAIRSSADASSFHVRRRPRAGSPPGASFSLVQDCRAHEASETRGSTGRERQGRFSGVSLYLPSDVESLVALGGDPMASHAASRVRRRIIGLNTLLAGRRPHPADAATHLCPEVHASSPLDRCCASAKVSARRSLH